MHPFNRTAIYWTASTIKTTVGPSITIFSLQFSQPSVAVLRCQNHTAVQRVGKSDSNAIILADHTRCLQHNGYIIFLIKETLDDATIVHLLEKIWVSILIFVCLLENVISTFDFHNIIRSLVFIIVLINNIEKSNNI